MTSRPDPNHAPDHVVRRVAAVFRPPAVRPGQSRDELAAAHLAQVRITLDAVWAEAYFAGVAYGLSATTTRAVLTISAEDAVEAIRALQAQANNPGMSRSVTATLRRLESLGSAVHPREAPEGTPDGF